LFEVATEIVTFRFGLLVKEKKGFGRGNWRSRLSDRRIWLWCLWEIWAFLQGDSFMTVASHKWGRFWD
jgi:hypothetical protein